MKRGIVMKKIVSCFIAICILSTCLCIPVYAETTDVSLNTNIYDGISYSEDVSLKQMEQLSPALKDVLREDGGVIVKIQDSPRPPVATRGMISPLELSAKIVVRRLRNNRTEFLLTVDKNIAPKYITIDKIALSWGGGLALTNDSCSIQEYAGGPYVNVRNQRSDVSANAGVGYQINTKFSDTSVLLRATVDTTASGSQMKNVVGTYARWTGGISIFSFSFGPGSITINAPWTTSYDQMSPVYSTFY